MDINTRATATYYIYIYIGRRNVIFTLYLFWVQVTIDFHLENSRWLIRRGRIFNLKPQENVLICILPKLWNLINRFKFFFFFRKDLHLFILYIVYIICIFEFIESERWESQMVVAQLGASIRFHSIEWSFREILSLPLI